MKIQRKNKAGNREKRFDLKRLFTILFAVVMIIMSIPVVPVMADTSGYDSTIREGIRSWHWVDSNSAEYRELYGDNAVIESTAANASSGDDTDIFAVDLISGLMGKFLLAIADSIDAILQRGDIDLSIDGIVYGRLNSGINMRMNLSHFGLEANNIWGIFGSSLYVILRNRFAFILIPVVGLIAIGKEAFKGGEKGRAGLKAVCSKLLMFFVLMFAVPFVLEAYIYIRDVAMEVTSEGLENIAGEISRGWQNPGGLYSSLRQQYSSRGGFVVPLVLLGYSFAGIIYLWDYVKIAMLIAVTFGLCPLMLIWWFFKPKILTDWANLLFPALLTPFVDMVLLMLPSFVSAMFTSVFGDNAESGLVLMIVLLACIWTARATRERILKLFGFEGIRGGGAAGLGLALAMLARGGMKHSGGNAEGGGTSGGKEGVGAASQGAEQMREAGNIMESADKEIAEINSSDYDTSQSDMSDTDALLDSMEAEDVGMEDTAELSSADENAGETVSEPVTSEIDEYDGDDEVPLESVGPDEGNREISAQGEGVSEVLGDNHISNEEVQSSAMRTDLADVGVQGEDVRTVAENMNSSGVKANELGVKDVSVGGATESLSKESGVRRSSSVGETLNSSLSGLTADQQKFVSKMPERDQKRFSNLQRIDALESNIAKNEMTMAKSGYSRGAYESAQSKAVELSSRMDGLKMEQQQIDARSKALEADRSAISADEYSRRHEGIVNDANRNERAVREVESAQKSNNDYLNSMASSRQADMQNTGYRQELDARRGVERQYATNSGLGGMSTKTYSNANEFLHQKQVDDIKKRHVDYTNFDTKQYDGILTPSEKENLYRERATKLQSAQRLERTARVASTVTGVVVGTTFGAGAMFAGPTAMASVGMASGKIAGRTAEGTVRTAEKAKDGVVNVANAAYKKSVDIIDRKTRARTESSDVTVPEQNVKDENRHVKNKPVEEADKNSSKAEKEGKPSFKDVEKEVKGIREGGFEKRERETPDEDLL